MEESTQAHRRQIEKLIVVFITGSNSIYEYTEAGVSKKMLIPAANSNICGVNYPVNCMIQPKNIERTELIKAGDKFHEFNVYRARAKDF
jgi:hypothetical protein